MQTFSTSGSLSFAHTTSRVAGSWTSPIIVIAIGVVSLQTGIHDAEPCIEDLSPGGAAEKSFAAAPDRIKGCPRDKS
jgi:hypothetical protein